MCITGAERIKLTICPLNGMACNGGQVVTEGTTIPEGATIIGRAESGGFTWIRFKCPFVDTDIEDKKMFPDHQVLPYQLECHRPDRVDLAADKPETETD